MLTLTCSPARPRTPSCGAGCPGPTACCGSSCGPSSGPSPQPANTRRWADCAWARWRRVETEADLGERKAGGQRNSLLTQQLLLLLRQLEVGEELSRRRVRLPRPRQNTHTHTHTHTRLTRSPPGLGGRAGAGGNTGSSLTTHESESSTLELHSSAQEVTSQLGVTHTHTQFKAAACVSAPQRAADAASGRSKWPRPPHQERRTKVTAEEKTFVKAQVNDS